MTPAAGRNPNVQLHKIGNVVTCNMKLDVDGSNPLMKGQNNDLFTLQEDFRPSVSLIVSGIQADGNVYDIWSIIIIIDTNGTVVARPNITDGGYIGFNVSFLVE